MTLLREQLKEGDILVCAADTLLYVGVKYAPSPNNRSALPTYNGKEAVLPRGTKVKIIGFWLDGDRVCIQPLNYKEIEDLLFPGLILDNNLKFLSGTDQINGLIYNGYYLSVAGSCLENFRKV